MNQDQGKEEKENEKIIRMCYIHVHVQTLHKDCNHYVMPTCDAKNKKTHRIEEIQI